MRASTRIWSLFAASFLVTAAFSAWLLRHTSTPNIRQRNATVPSVIVPLSPGLAEIVWALGLGHRIAAVTDNTRYPKALRRLPHVGGFLTPNLELIARAKPDLVICRKAQAGLAKRLTSLGIRTLALPDQSLDDILSSIRQIGAVTNRKKDAEALAASLEQRMARLRRRGARMAHPKVLLVVGRSDETLRSIYAAGPKTLLGELIRLAGGTNVVTTSVAAYPVVSMEFLETAQVDVIVEINAPPTSMPKTTILESWRQLSRVAQGKARVVVIQDASWLIPGPRILDAAERLQRILASLQSDRAPRTMTP